MSCAGYKTTPLGKGAQAARAEAGPEQHWEDPARPLPLDPRFPLLLRAWGFPGLSPYPPQPPWERRAAPPFDRWEDEGPDGSAASLSASTRPDLAPRFVRPEPSHFFTRAVMHLLLASVGTWPTRGIRLLIAETNGLCSQDNRGLCPEFSPIITEREPLLFLLCLQNTFTAGNSKQKKKITRERERKSAI